MLDPKRRPLPSLDLWQVSFFFNCRHSVWSGCQFHQRSTSSFCTCRTQSTKRLTTSLSFLRFQNLRASKLLIECWWNWPQVCSRLPLLPVIISSYMIGVSGGRINFKVFSVPLKSTHLCTPNKHQVLCFLNQGLQGASFQYKCQNKEGSGP